MFHPQKTTSLKYLSRLRMGQNNTQSYIQSISPAVRCMASQAQPESTPKPYRLAAQTDVQLLQKSVIPTMHFQRSLPRLPVPKLEKTIERYLKAQEPLLSADELAKTTKFATEFLEKEGKELHDQLVATDKRRKGTSYISDLWFDMYLKSRAPLVLDANPFIAMNDNPKKESMNQAFRATDLTVSALRFRNSLQAGLLEPDVYHLNPKKTDNATFRRVTSLLPEALSWYGAYLYKAFPLDMSQYGRLFNSTRIPRKDKDELFTDNKAQHVAVLCNGVFFTFDACDPNGNIISPKEILHCYQYVLQNAATAKPAESIAVFSGGERNQWAALRAQLIDAGNESLLKKIDSAIILVCLDSTESRSLNSEGDVPNVKQYCKNSLHGDGSNRWFDKSFSLIVDRSGRAAVNFEHAWGDGVAVLRFFNEVHKDVNAHNFALTAVSAGPQVDPSSYVSRLDFKLTDPLKQSVTIAHKEFQTRVAALDLSILEYHGFGKEKIKEFKFYPDGIMQLAFQMAYFKQTNGQTAATYESCSTAAFRHGRTECIRSATTLTKQFCQKVASKSGSPSEMRALLQATCAYHGQLTKEAAMGQGFDRHLFALRHLAEGHGKKLPIFTDPAYAKINHNILSTSTLQSPAIAAGGFAPVVPDGYGVGYSSMDHKMGVVAFYYPTRNGKEFTDAVKESFDDMLKIMNAK